MTNQDIKTKCRSICNEVGRENISNDLKKDKAEKRISDELNLCTSICFHSSGRMVMFMGMAHGETEIVFF